MSLENGQSGPGRFEAEISVWRQQLDGLGLSPDNSVVIGSGIMQALGLRCSRDLDLVVSRAVYRSLSSCSDLVAGETCGRPVLAGDGLEVFWSWPAVSDENDLDYLKRHSVVVGAIRYISLEFLLGVKEGWVAAGEGRPKDQADIDLIKSHLQK